MTAKVITTVEVPGVPLKLQLYTKPENMVVDDLPDMVLPMEIVGSGINPEVSDLYVKIEKLDTFELIPQKDWPTICNHVVNTLDVELRKPVCMNYFGKRMMLHDRSTNGVEVDTKDAQGNDIKKPVTQTKGQVAIIILRHVFRTGPKTMVVLENDIYDPVPKFAISISTKCGLTITTVDHVKYVNALKQSTQPYGMFKLHGVEYHFVMGHPFVNLRDNFEPTYLHALVAGYLFKLSTHLKMTDCTTQIAHTEFFNLKTA